MFDLKLNSQIKLHYPYSHFLTPSSLLHPLNIVTNQMCHEQIATEIILTLAYFVYMIVYQEKSPNESDQGKTF